MTHCHTRHSAGEKLFFRFTILGSYVIAAYAIFQHSLWWALAYAVFLFAALEWVVYRFCSYCPYPCDHSNCLMMPYQLATKYNKPNRKPQNLLDRFSFPVVMIVLLPLIPQYWLIKDKTLLLLFWIFTILAWAAMLTFKCSHCLYRACPLNRTPE